MAGPPAFCQQCIQFWIIDTWTPNLLTCTSTHISWSSLRTWADTRGVGGTRLCCWKSNIRRQSSRTWTFTSTSQVVKWLSEYLMRTTFRQELKLTELKVTLQWFIALKKYKSWIAQCINHKMHSIRLQWASLKCHEIFQKVGRQKPDS